MNKGNMLIVTLGRTLHVWPEQVDMYENTVKFIYWVPKTLEVLQVKNDVFDELSYLANRSSE